MTCRLILLIGLPGSGKSTWAAQLQHHSPKHRIISTDRIRADFFGDAAIQGAWAIVWQAVLHQLQQAVVQIHQGTLQAAVYDATNAQRRQRRRVITAAHQAGFTEVVGLWLDTPLGVCLERNRQRQRQVPVEIIDTMARQLQGAPPHVQEGLDLLIQCSGDDPAQLPPDLCAALGLLSTPTP